jgi:hypothetical protein
MRSERVHEGLAPAHFLNPLERWRRDGVDQFGGQISQPLQKILAYIFFRDPLTIYASFIVCRCPFPARLEA